MKRKEIQSEEDILEQMKTAWQAHCRHTDHLPGLSDEDLERIYANCEREREKMPPLTWRRERLAWMRVLATLVSLGAAVCGMVACVSMWGDVPLRLLLCVVVGVSLLCVVWSVKPFMSILFRSHCRESLNTIAADGLLPTMDYYVLKDVLLMGVTSFAILAIATRLPVGDGYHTAMIMPGRLYAINNINYLITHIV